MESEERFLFLLHFRTDIARCRWTVGVSLSAGEKETPGFWKESLHCASQTHCSALLSSLFVKKKKERRRRRCCGACDKGRVELLSLLLSAHQHLQPSNSPSFAPSQSAAALSLLFCCCFLSLPFSPLYRLGKLSHTAWGWRSGQL